MHLHRTPKIVGYTSCLRSESNRDCFSNRVLSRGKVSLERIEWEDGGDLMRLFEPSLQLVCNRAHGVVPVAPTPIEVQAHDSDHETSDQVTTKPRRMTRMRTTSNWHVILSWKSCC